jgi:hypothetical protein
MAARDEPADEDEDEDEDEEDDETAGDASAFMLLASATALLRLELAPPAALGVVPANAPPEKAAAARLAALPAAPTD